MAHNQLAEKLDQVSEHELGFDFDEGAVWNKLEHRLDNRKTFVYWWVIAACLLIGFTFLPISLLKESEVQTGALSDQVAAPTIEVPTVVATEVEKTIVPPGKEMRIVEKKGLAEILLAQVSQVELHLEPIAVAKQRDYKTVFAAEDISVIQASLERPSAEKGRTITIRAQWQKSPENLNVNYQALKIKLNEEQK